MQSASPSASNQPWHDGPSAVMMPYADGFALHPIRSRAAAATPSQWTDVVITAVAADGTITLTEFLTGESFDVWHHASLVGEGLVGIPATYHRRYHVLQFGEHEAISVAVARPHENSEQDVR